MSEPRGPRVHKATQHRRADSRAWQTGLRIGEVAFPILTMAFAAVGNVVGVVHIPLWASLPLAAALSGFQYFALHALRGSDHTKQVGLLWSALVFAMVIAIGVFCYNQWGDPQKRAAHMYSMVVTGPDAAVWQEADMPGGPKSMSLNSVAGGWIIQVDCFGPDEHGKHWYRVSGQGNGFLPPEALAPAYGVDGSKIPAC